MISRVFTPSLNHIFLLLILLFHGLSLVPEELQGAGRESPLFPTTVRKTKQLTGNAMTAVDMCRMVKRRMKAIGLPPQLSPHSFRVTTMTDLLKQGVALDEVQHLIGHSHPRPRTTSSSASG